MFYWFKTKGQVEKICYNYYEKCLKKCVEVLLQKSNNEFVVRGDPNCPEVEDKTTSAGMITGGTQWEETMTKTVEMFSRSCEDDKNYRFAAHKALQFAARTLVKDYYNRTTTHNHITGDSAAAEAVAYDYHVWGALADSATMLDSLVKEARIYALFVKVL